MILQAVNYYTSTYIYSFIKESLVLIAKEFVFVVPTVSVKCEFVHSNRGNMCSNHTALV